jgi:DNA polymerase I-like protein with 3'-5' exonuclease and polymerase domains
VLKPLLEDPSILKIGQNLKYDIEVLKRTAWPCPRSTTRC